MTFNDFLTFAKSTDYKYILAAWGETRVLAKDEKGNPVSHQPVGGVPVVFDPISLAINATYIAIAKERDEELVKNRQKELIKDARGEYLIKRMYLPEALLAKFYYGFSNQTLWPLCHVAFERPDFKDEWYEGYEKVNKMFAQEIKSEIKGKAFVWINDYQLALVPHFLGRQRKDVTIAYFWHIPWPTWEAFRILPQKKEILESLLKCDFLGFHRGYHVQNFFTTVERELEARIDRETGKIHYKNHATTVRNLPLGIDTQTVKDMIREEATKSLISKAKSLLGDKEMNSFLEQKREGKIILGVDRIDYTKGLILRLEALDFFFEMYPEYKGKVRYFGIVAPSREQIPSYERLYKAIIKKADELNSKYKRGDWEPVEISHKIYTRQELLTIYENADVCLITPRDDGMNLVSKEFVLCASVSENPGMLVLSQFAGSAIDLTEALIVNPYDAKETAEAIKKALEMKREEKVARIKKMEAILEEKNAYQWAHDFIEQAIRSK